jgi:hypothetical protein
VRSICCVPKHRSSRPHARAGVQAAQAELQRAEAESAQEARAVDRACTSPRQEERLKFTALLSGSVAAFVRALIALMAAGPVSPIGDGSNPGDSSSPFIGPGLASAARQCRAHSSGAVVEPGFEGALSRTGSSAGASGVWHIFWPSHRWPHQQRPSESMMQVPLPQQRGSSVMLNSPRRSPRVCPRALCRIGEPTDPALGSAGARGS